MVWLRMVYTLFSSLASSKIISLVAPGILSTFFSIHSYHALEISLSHRDQTEVSSLKDFSKNSSTFTYFCHHTAIYSFSNWFICFDLFLYIFISFITRTFSPSARFFHIPYCSRNYLTNSVDHLFFRGTPGFWDYVINMKCKQSNDVSTLPQKYSPVFKRTTVTVFRKMFQIFFNSKSFSLYARFLNRDYFMVGECVRFLFTSCERLLSERLSALNERVWRSFTTSE